MHFPSPRCTADILHISTHIALGLYYVQKGVEATEPSSLLLLSGISEPQPRHPQLSFAGAGLQRAQPPPEKGWQVGQVSLSCAGSQDLKESGHL